jgi:hypothetical protein
MHSGIPPLPAQDRYPGIALLLRARPNAHPEAARILFLLRTEAGAGFLAAEAVAAQLGLSSRHALARRLQSLGLPRYRELHMWIRLLAMLGDSDPAHPSLSAIALCRGADPSSWFRLVRRLTGRKWSEIVSLSAAQLAMEVADLFWQDGVRTDARANPIASSPSSTAPRNDTRG